MAAIGPEGPLRELAPQVLGAVVRRFGNFDHAEDATQEALAAAARQWANEGVPADPRAWLVRVASRRLIDMLRSRQAREQREGIAAGWELSRVDTSTGADLDDSLALLFLCSHRCLTPTAQIALTLRAVGGLTTTEIARAFLTSESTITRRITRAKQSIRAAGATFTIPTRDEAGERLDSVMQVLYLIFNEGYASTTGARLHRRELSTEAIRLARLLHRVAPDDSEVAGLLALMLLTDARRAARTDASGGLVPMTDQNRDLWDRDQIAEGIGLISAARVRGPIGAFQIQAAIAAIHDEAPSSESTDWRQIVAFYHLLRGIADNPIVALNQAVAVAMVDGPVVGLMIIDQLESEGHLRDDHRLHSVRAHLLERRGDTADAIASFELAARHARNMTVQRYLNEQIDRIRQTAPGAQCRTPPHDD
ncbi:MAG: polymerase subunit sigma-24 [Ilumatobacteraceae bacterium]|nr:polymerase subunit sigma-24 [Ilumatobacteraceae bacterium]